jgi:hypothetical protein
LSVYEFWTNSSVIKTAVDLSLGIGGRTGFSGWRDFSSRSQ